MDRIHELARPAAHRPRQGLVGWLLSLLAIRRQRRRLASLDAAMLRDIGLTRDDALREAGRAPWDGPAHWRD